MKNKYLLVLATVTSLIAVGVLANLPNPYGLPDRHLLIDSVEQGETVRYAYNTKIPVELDKDEIVERRTANSRTVRLPDGDLKVLIDTAEPKYYQDIAGRWWLVAYGVTTKERFDAYLTLVPPWEKVSLWVATRAYAATEFLTSGTSWSTPVDWNDSNNSIECIGAGGSGQTASAGVAGAGGGGGAYAKVTNVTLSGSISYVVASGGSQNDTYFNGAASSTASISCAAGKNGSGATAGAGGSTADSTGTVEYAGGAGGIGQAVTTNNAAGAGGGSAGPTGAGQAGGDSIVGIGDGGAGGGGSNGGSSTAGGIQVDSTTGSAGGHGTGGTGGGAGGTGNNSGSAGTDGGGGGGSGRPNDTDDIGGAGGCDTAFTTHGACGGGGAGGSASTFGGDGGAGGTYGGGGGGGGKSTDANAEYGTAGTGGQGLIVIIYTPAADTTAPTPDPMTFDTAPNDASATSVSMTATTATDPSAPVEYLFGYFACASNGGTGGTASAWQSSASYTDSGLEPNHCYGYKVEARDSVGNRTASSTQAEAYTAANIPGTPTLGSATVSTLALTNDANSNPSANPTTSFAVQVTTTTPTDATWLNKYVDASGNPSATAVWLTDSQLDSLAVAGLSSNTAYSVQVKARNESQEETSFSSAGSGTTLTGAPGTPTFSAVTSSTLTVSWTAPSAGASSYKVERCSGTGCSNFAEIATGVGGTSYNDTSLSANTTYLYRVRATNGGGDGAYSGTGTTLTLPGTPGTPTFSSVVTTTLTVEWTAPTGGAASYKVERCAGVGCVDFAQIASGVVGTSYGDTLLTNGSTYRYRVRATNGTGDGAYSGNGSVATGEAQSGTDQLFRINGGVRFNGGVRLP